MMLFHPMEGIQIILIEPSACYHNDGDYNGKWFSKQGAPWREETREPGKGSPIGWRVFFLIAFPLAFFPVHGIF